MSVLILSLCLDIFFFLLYTLWIISLIMKNRFIINMSIHKVYGSKIIEKFVYVKIKLTSTHTKKTFAVQAFFHQMYNYESKTAICKWDFRHLQSAGEFDSGQLRSRDANEAVIRKSTYASRGVPARHPHQRWHPSMATAGMRGGMAPRNAQKYGARDHRIDDSGVDYFRETLNGEGAGSI